MMTFEKDMVDPDTEHWLERLESAMLAATLAATSDLPPERRKAMMRTWLETSFNAASHGIDLTAGYGAGIMTWLPYTETQIDLIYSAATGLNCSLARAYQQANGSWAAMVIAGVRDTSEEAQAAAEWAISRLTVEERNRSRLDDEHVLKACRVYF